MDDDSYIDGFLLFSYAVAIWVLYKHAAIYKRAKDAGWV
jgi:hypothetical protein